MRVCVECHLPLIRSTSFPGAWLCPSAWDECDRSGVRVRVAA